MRYVVRTPFGIALQGIRDDPPRMRSLGYNVPLHRTLAFTLGAFVAAIAGILSVWFNTQISPGSIDITQTIDVLIIAVIGGLSRLEGAWIGALAFALIDYYSRQHTPTLGLWLNPGRSEHDHRSHLPADRAALSGRADRDRATAAREARGTSW